MLDFVEVCRRGLKVNASKSKVMVLKGEGDWCVGSVWIGCDWSMCWNLLPWVCFDESGAYEMK